MQDFVGSAHDMLESNRQIHLFGWESLVQESWLLDLELIKFKPFLLETAVPSNLPGMFSDIDQLLLNLTLSDMNFSLD
jgi:hypothetical protein